MEEEKKLHYCVRFYSPSEGSEESCWLYVVDMIYEGQGAVSSSPR